MDFTYFNCDNETVKMAYYVAMGDLVSNIKLFTGGLSDEEKSVVIAGMGYCTPWTRDASINSSNAVSLLFPEIAKNTLISVLENKDGKIYIDGQYWDKIIWTLGAWKQYLLTGDREFLKLSYEATVNTLEYMEQTEFDSEKNLFFGPACYGDGVAAYPDEYAISGDSCILSYAHLRPELCKNTKEGIPMITLSTNCLYYRAYVIADMMADTLGLERKYENKADTLKKAINSLFYMEDKGFYRYMIDSFGGSDAQEGMGNSFAILFGIADSEKTEKILSSLQLTEHGIACVMPSFARYTTEKGHYGRHSGTIWPHIEAFFADAALMGNRKDLFEKELFMLAQRAVRDGHFSEIYHPDTGERYGGLQEMDNNGIIEWKSELKQTWSATGYLRLLFGCILGLKVSEEKIEFAPFMPNGITNVSFNGIRIRDIELDVKISGSGNKISSFTVNGEKSDMYSLPLNSSGKYTVNIVL